MSKENEELENDLTEVVKTESEESDTKNDNASEADTKEADSKADDSEENPKSESNVKKIVVLGILSVICIALIVVAIILSTKKNKDNDNSSTSEESTSSAQASAGEVSNNALTKEECLEKVASGEMIELTDSNGNKIYCYDYNNKDLIKSKIKVSDEEIDEFANSLISYFPQYEEITDRDTVETGDIANIDFEGKVDGVAFDGGTSKSYDLGIGSGTFIPGFEDQIIGMKVGETKDIEVTFPDDYSAELAGKDAVFTVTVNKISKEVEATELTDEMVSEYFSYYGYDIATVDDMYKFLREDGMSGNLSSLIFEQFYVESYDEQLVKDFYAEFDNYLNNLATSSGMSVEEYLTYSGMTVADAEASGMEMARSSAKVTALVQAIAEKEGITASDDDLDGVLSQLGFADLESYEASFGKDDPCLQYYGLQDAVMRYVFGLYDLKY